MAFGSRRALDTAKRNVESSYPVVGVLEDLPETLAVLEAKLPNFFSGIAKIYETDLNCTLWTAKICQLIRHYCF